jgi:hypothetical protein
MKFLDDPTLKVHGDDWQLVTPLLYLRSDHGLIAVPTGFVTDLASIPRVFHPLIPVNGKHRAAAIIHDYLYETQTTTRAEADLIFLEAMEASGVRFTQRWAMYLAVRMGGWMAWNKRRTSQSK